MTDRDRLIELMEQGVHKTPCEYDEDCDCTGIKCDACVRGSIADHLLANGVIVPPCKVGDKVFWATTSIDENCEEIPTIEIGEVFSFSLQEEGLWAYCRYESGLTYWHLVADYFGKTVFLTKEEAEAKLKEMSNNASC